MYVENITFNFKSEYLNREVALGVVLPDEVKKIVILLHGYGGTYRILKDTLPLEEYARKYKIMLVTPDMGNGYYIDKENFNVSGFIACELLEFIRRAFGISEETGVILSGISMGGYGSVLIGTKYPEKFEEIISISGAFVASDVAIGNPEIVGTGKPGEVFRYFQNIFGPFDTLEDSTDRNPLAAVKAITPEKMPPLVITYGSEDRLIIRGQKLKLILDERKLRYDWKVFEGGDHVAASFDEGLRYAFDTCCLFSE